MGAPPALFGVLIKLPYVFHNVLEATVCPAGAILANNALSAVSVFPFSISSYVYMFFILRRMQFSPRYFHSLLYCFADAAAVFCLLLPVYLSRRMFSVLFFPDFSGCCAV